MELALACFQKSSPSDPWSGLHLLPHLCFNRDIAATDGTEVPARTSRVRPVRLQGHSELNSDETKRQRIGISFTV